MRILETVGVAESEAKEVFLELGQTEAGRDRVYIRCQNMASALFLLERLRLHAVIRPQGVLASGVMVRRLYE